MLEQTLSSVSETATALGCSWTNTWTAASAPTVSPSGSDRTSRQPRLRTPGLHARERRRASRTSNPYLANVILSRPRDQRSSRRDRPGTLRDGDDVMITGMVVVALPLAPLVVAVMFLSDEHERKSK
jgi:hypothetical protein